jgi:hypothetical protein
LNGILEIKAHFGALAESKKFFIALTRTTGKQNGNEHSGSARNHGVQSGAVAYKGES